MRLDEQLESVDLWAGPVVQAVLLHFIQCLQLLNLRSLDTCIIDLDIELEKGSKEHDDELKVDLSCVQIVLESLSTVTLEPHVLQNFVELLLLNVSMSGLR